jgi:hypothetical protein
MAMEDDSGSRDFSATQRIWHIAIGLQLVAAGAALAAFAVRPTQRVLWDRLFLVASAVCIFSAVVAGLCWRRRNTIWASSRLWAAVGMAFIAGHHLLREDWVWGSGWIVFTMIVVRRVRRPTSR